VRLEAAVEAGARALGGEPFFERNRGRFWTLYETRPYVRARERLAERLHAAGRVDEAILHYEALLELDRDDGLAVRHALVGALLERGELEKARRWLDHEEDLKLATPAWARALERFLSGDRVGAARAVRAARERNRYVEPVLLGTEELPSDLRGFTPGRPSEALEVELRLGDAWRASAEAFDWLDQGATVTTEEQREAAIASYREPVAALLRVGDRAIGGGQGELDFDRLAPGDIAELERMALDPALHELEADEPAVWAPLHALRILARTRAAESVPVFVALARESEETDEALLDDLTAAFSAAGPAALAPCEALLAERAERISPRKIAAIVLADLARRPELRERALAVLLAGFRNHADEPQRLNDMLALALGTLAPQEIAPLLEDAIEQGSLSEAFVEALALENPDEA
jgi:tetratricopeptide (TPR) repeat protein